MKHFTNINVGLDRIAKTYLELKKEPGFEPMLIATLGTNKSIKLHRYKLKDGSYAEEFLQMIIKNEKDQNLYFLGLIRKSKTFVWSGDKIIKKLKKNSSQ